MAGFVYILPKIGLK